MTSSRSLNSFSMFVGPRVSKSPSNLVSARIFERISRGEVVRAAGVRVSCCAEGVWERLKPLAGKSLSM